MNCPSCNETLVMADKQGIEIDYCPKCRGVWLDRGELDKIVERSAGYEKRGDYNDHPATGTSYPKQDSYKHDPYYKHSDQYKYKKKKGFLSDFFDFD